MPHYSVFLGVNTTDRDHDWTDIWVANREGISNILLQKFNKKTREYEVKYEKDYEKYTRGEDTFDLDYSGLKPRVHTCYKYSTILEGQTKRDLSPSKKDHEIQNLITEGGKENVEIWQKLEQNFRREMEHCFD